MMMVGERNRTNLFQLYHSFGSFSGFTTVVSLSLI
jgi:hypothetical protein